MLDIDTSQDLEENELDDLDTDAEEVPEEGSTKQSDEIERLEPRDVQDFIQISENDIRLASCKLNLSQIAGVLTYLLDNTKVQKIISNHKHSKPKSKPTMVK